jgi:hypothetical protein
MVPGMVPGARYHLRVLVLVPGVGVGVGVGHGCRVLVLVPGLMYELFELPI